MPIYGSRLKYGSMPKCKYVNIPMPPQPRDIYKLHCTVLTCRGHFMPPIENYSLQEELIHRLLDEWVRFCKQILYFYNPRLYSYFYIHLMSGTRDNIFFR